MNTSERLKHQIAMAVKEAVREKRERARDIVLAHEKGCTSIDPMCLRVMADQITMPAVSTPV